MASEVGSAYVTLIPSAKGFASKMQSELGGEVGRFGDQAGDDYSKRFSSKASSGIKSRGKAIMGGLAKGGALAAAAAGAAAIKFVGGALSEARDAEVIGARTANVIKSMGGAAGVTSKQVADLAGSISNKTGIDDEAIQAGQNMLLTFGQIRNEAGKGNDIFNQSSQLMTDMSAAMGTDAKSAALQLGKALNDPQKGVTALTRSGVSFTQQQKDQIAKLQESGDMLGAQKIILGEVKKQFGGAAESMATPAEKAKVAWGNFQEEIGTALLPTADKVLTAFSNALPKILKFGEELRDKIAPHVQVVVDAVQRFIEKFRSGSGEAGKLKTTLTNAFTDIKRIVKGVVEVVVAIWQSGFGQRLLGVLRGAFEAAQKILGGALRVIKGVINVVMGIIKGDWGRAWQGIKQILSGVWQIIKATIKQALNVVKAVIKTAWDVIKGIFSRAWDLIKTVVSKGIDKIVSLAKTIGGKIKSALSSLGSTIKSIFTRAWDAARNAASSGMNKIIDGVRELPAKIRALGSKFLDAGRAIIGKFVDGLRNAGGLVSDVAGNVWDAVRGFINDAIDRLNAALEFTINPPGPGTLTINAPDIPKLATGARVTGATLAMIGEGSEAETVLPDSVLRGLLERTAAAASAQRSAVGHLTITNWRDGTGYFRLVADDVLRDESSFRRDIGVMHA